MAPQIQTQQWTRQDIIETVSLLAKKRYGQTIADFIAAMNSGTLDPCEDGDLMALLRMLPEDDELLAA